MADGITERPNDLEPVDQTDHIDGGLSGSAEAVAGTEIVTSCGVVYAVQGRKGGADEVAGLTVASVRVEDCPRVSEDKSAFAFGRLAGDDTRAGAGGYGHDEAGCQDGPHRA